jgi:hypothetical protein
MARSIQEIQNEIITAKENHTVLNELNNTSRSAVWRLFTYINAVAIFTLESLFDKHSDQIDEKIAELKPHNARWYRNTTLNFQYGYSLLKDTHLFDNSGKQPGEIEQSKVIKYAAVTESDDQSRLIIKIATENSGTLAPVNTAIFQSLKAYVSEFKDAGVKVTIINYLPDRLRLSMRIIRDPLVLNSEGVEITTGKSPVESAIKDFIKNLPFDGRLSLQKLEEKLLTIKGIKDLKIDIAETAWIDPKVKGYGQWKVIDISTIPVSGYYTINLHDNNDFKSIIKYE